ncbi:MAG TPA: hypothetical protein VF163_06625 [Micromonosporaceae bacterium]
MTTRALFADDEWNLIVRLPRWVVAAASAAQHDVAYRTNIEVEVGLIASADGRSLGSPFVTEVADQTLRVFDMKGALEGIDLSDREAGIAAVIEHARRANQILLAKAERADLLAYRAWLLKITNVVIKAARSGDFLGIGGKRVTAAEHEFRDQLELALHD